MMSLALIEIYDGYGMDCFLEKDSVVYGFRLPT
jgi:hypothetical protein